MEKKTMGSFMSALRKANGLTQQQVADKLNVSNKTVSKWECDEGYPEITMLPAIAEIYSVTVDELLRGERVSKEELNDSLQNFKSEKQAKYLFDTATSKYSTLSIISIVLCALSLIISMLLYHTIWGIVLVILLIGAAVITQVIAFMNFKPLTQNPDELLDEKLIIRGKEKIRTYIVCVFALSVLSLLIIMLTDIIDLDFLVAFAFNLFITIILSVILYRFITHKTDLDKVLSQKYITYRKHTTKRLAVVIAVVFAIACVVPYITVYISEKQPDMFCFSDDEYIYEADDCAKTDYFKFKNHILNGNDIYFYNYFVGETEIEVLKFTVESIKENDVIKLTDVTDGDFSIFEFETEEELNEFIKNNVVNPNLYGFVYDSAMDGNEIAFDDATLTIILSKTSTDWYLVHDILPLYLLFATLVSLIIVGIGTVYIYYQKKRLS